MDAPPTPVVSVQPGNNQQSLSQPNSLVKRKIFPTIKRQEMEQNSEVINNSNPTLEIFASNPVSNRAPNSIVPSHNENLTEALLLHRTSDNQNIHLIPSNDLLDHIVQQENS